jgi:hypothetical protein
VFVHVLIHALLSPLSRLHPLPSQVDVDPEDNDNDKVDDKLCSKACGGDAAPIGTCGKSFLHTYMCVYTTAELHIRSRACCAANQFYTLLKLF